MQFGVRRGMIRKCLPCAGAIYDCTPTRMSENMHSFGSYMLAENLLVVNTAMIYGCNSGLFIRCLPYTISCAAHFIGVFSRNIVFDFLLLRGGHLLHT
jgi:hypothetical protein